jgi:flagellar motility protein MotE (MotC chaperone)
VRAANKEAAGAADAAAVAPAKSTTAAGRSGKVPAKVDAPAPAAAEPAEEMIPEAPGKARNRKRTSARRPVTEDRGPEVQERKSNWSADRYSAVVPPGLTLAALRSQLAKSPTADSQPPSATEHSTAPPEQMLAEIAKARESLRQETARLETLIKANGNCQQRENYSEGSSMGPVDLHEAPGEQIDSVSKAMKGMKPEQAAALVSRLNRGLAAEILRRMKATDAGAILGMLKPELAADLATEIATKKPMKKAVAK